MLRLPTPPNLSIAWNFGSLLGLFLVVQLVSGLFLAMHYTPTCEAAFDSVIHIVRDVNSGWWVRSIHANGATLFFVFLYCHLARNIYHGSHYMVGPWLLGAVLFLLGMGVAFMGYVLPWGQMSYWAATVITSLLTAIPEVGPKLVEWVWGGYSVGDPTLHRFFVLHFALPFVMVALVIGHIVLLHSYGSSNPLGVNSDVGRVPFHPYFTVKDLVGVGVAFGALAVLVLVLPHLTTEPDNFIEANPLVTPTHIKPEWYFLWAYALLRSVPHKLGGVLVLVVALAWLFLAPLAARHSSSCAFKPFRQAMFFALVVNFFLLSWLGSVPAEEPYLSVTLGLSVSFLVLLWGWLVPWGRIWARLGLMNEE